MALPKPEPEPATIAIPAALYARVKEIAGGQHRTPDELVTVLIRDYVGDLSPAERRAEFVRRSEEERLRNADRPGAAHDPLDAFRTIAAELFSTDEDAEFLLRFIESGVIDDER